MTEFDFDELDKAVNNLMSGVDMTKRNAALDDPEDNIVALTSSDTAQSQAITPVPAAVVVNPNPVPNLNNDNASVSSLAAKRRGKFMDIVNPSSDMKNPARINRMAPSVQRVNPSVSTATGQDVPVPVTPPATQYPEAAVALSFDMESTGEVGASTAPAPQGITPSEESQQGVGRKSDWPDPIDVAEQQAIQQPELTPTDMAVVDTPRTESIKTEDSSVAVDQPQQVDDNSQESVAELASPLTSPFLPDAKVEKRPLGEPVPLQEPESQTTVSDSPPLNQPEPITEAAATVATVTLPEDRNKDIIALELSTTMPKPQSTLESDTPKPSTTPVMPGGGSIPQQYSEQPSTSDQTNGSIYDTQNYHQAVESAAPKKKSSLLKLIILILALVIIGAMAGAAYFYFTHY